MTNVEKMLIFNNADDDAVMIPLHRIEEINGGTGEIVLNTSAGSDIDVITLTTGADEFQACKELIQFINSTHSDGALVVADDVAGTYCTPLITGVAIA